MEDLEKRRWEELSKVVKTAVYEYPNIDFIKPYLLRHQKEYIQFCKLTNTWEVALSLGMIKHPSLNPVVKLKEPDLYSLLFKKRKLCSQSSEQASAGDKMDVDEETPEKAEFDKGDDAGEGKTKSDDVDQENMPSTSSEPSSSGINRPVSNRPVSPITVEKQELHEAVVASSGDKEDVNEEAPEKAKYDKKDEAGEGKTKSDDVDQENMPSTSTASSSSGINLPSSPITVEKLELHKEVVASSGDKMDVDEETSEKAECEKEDEAGEGKTKSDDVDQENMPSTSTASSSSGINLPSSPMTVEKQELHEAVVASPGDKEDVNKEAPEKFDQGDDAGDSKAIPDDADQKSAPSTSSVASSSGINRPVSNRPVSPMSAAKQDLYEAVVEHLDHLAETEPELTDEHVEHFLTSGAKVVKEYLYRNQM